ncbi:MAG TPA: 1,2-phenylacetyl-CoA epoxidase subunit PaaD [candidate division Zixibacteria bacterium]|nr:1,2-phenylacetyl-CoA epoxidase subunit PaaD [candidate division Zixibacteria bacterium]
MVSNNKQLSPSTILEALEKVMDPEIPVISIVEMGLIRNVSVGQVHITVQMTPTFSGCPALQTIKADIERCVRDLGGEKVVVETVLDPPWSSDWITDQGREKLRKFGLAPPPKHGGRIEVTFFESAACPYCDSQRTVLKNDFGPTLCRSIYYCNSCQQPFEQFKAL